MKYFRIGKIVNTQGIKGEVRVIPLTDDINRFDDLKCVYIDDDKLIEKKIEYVKYHKSFVIIKFTDIDSMNKAEELTNMYILISRDNAIKLPEGSYFISDLIDINVYDNDNNFLGRISDIVKTGSNDVYVVKKDEAELLIPALKSIVKSIDIKESKIIVELPEGLVDDEN